MRSLVVAGMLGVLMLVPAAAVADDRPVVRQEQFDTYCTPTDPALDELSGLTFSDGVLYAIGDSGTDHRVAVLDENCAVTRWIDVPVDPYDVEDLASHGGQLWLADVGDNLRRRDTVALTRIDPATGDGELYRLVYPDGPHDAETVLIEPGGRPVIVTKEPSGGSGVYIPERGATVSELPSPGPTALTKVGDLPFEGTETPGGPPFIAGSLLATGGAVSADGTTVAVRTYNDVYLFPVVDGNVVQAIQGDPTVVALPVQPQGEAVAFGDDGSLLVASEAAGGQLPPIERLVGATTLVSPPPAPTLTETSSGGRWTFGALAGAGVLVFASILYTFGRARRQ
ncbi:MAG: hypothetical protein WBD41_30630 [Rhodococcus sp. (in: high G+C Gram-positive bacteria)]|jgi:hypothetical protein